MSTAIQIADRIHPRPSCSAASRPSSAVGSSRNRGHHATATPAERLESLSEPSPRVPRLSDCETGGGTDTTLVDDRYTQLVRTDTVTSSGSSPFVSPWASDVPQTMIPSRFHLVDHASGAKIFPAQFPDADDQVTFLASVLGEMLEGLRGRVSQGRPSHGLGLVSSGRQLASGPTKSQGGFRPAKSAAATAAARAAAAPASRSPRGGAAGGGGGIYHPSPPATVSPRNYSLNSPARPPRTPVPAVPPNSFRHPSLGGGGSGSGGSGGLDGANDATGDIEGDAAAWHTSTASGWTVTQQKHTPMRPQSACFSKSQRAVNVNNNTSTSAQPQQPNHGSSMNSGARSAGRREGGGGTTGNVGGGGGTVRGDVQRTAELVEVIMYDFEATMTESAVLDIALLEISRQVHTRSPRQALLIECIRTRYAEFWTVVRQHVKGIRDEHSKGLDGAAVLQDEITRMQHLLESRQDAADMVRDRLTVMLQTTATLMAQPRVMAKVSKQLSAVGKGLHKRLKTCKPPLVQLDSDRTEEVEEEEEGEAPDALNNKGEEDGRSSSSSASLPLDPPSSSSSTTTAAVTISSESGMKQTARAAAVSAALAAAGRKKRTKKAEEGEVSEAVEDRMTLRGREAAAKVAAAAAAAKAAKAAKAENEEMSNLGTAAASESMGLTLQFDITDVSTGRSTKNLTAGDKLDALSSPGLHNASIMAQAGVVSARIAEAEAVMVAMDSAVGVLCTTTIESQADQRALDARLLIAVDHAEAANAELDRTLESHRVRTLPENIVKHTAGLFMTATRTPADREGKLLKMDILRTLADRARFGDQWDEHFEEVKEEENRERERELEKEKEEKGEPMKKSVAGGGGQGNGAGGVGAATAAAAGGAERVQRSPHHTDLTITNITHAHKAATNVRHRESKAIHALRRPAPTANMVHAYEAISAMAYHIQGSSLIHLVNFLLNDDHHAQSHCTWEPGSGQRPEKDPRDGTTNINRSRPLPGLKRVDITNLAKAQYSSLCDKERWGCPDGGFLARAKAAQPTVVQGELALDLGLQPLALPLQVGTDEVMSDDPREFITALINAAAVNNFGYQFMTNIVQAQCFDVLVEDGKPNPHSCLFPLLKLLAAKMTTKQALSAAFIMFDRNKIDACVNDEKPRQVSHLAVRWLMNDLREQKLEQECLRHAAVRMVQMNSSDLGGADVRIKRVDTLFSGVLTKALKDDERPQVLKLMFRHLVQCSSDTFPDCVEYILNEYVTDSDDFCKIIEQAVDNFALDPEQLSGLLINLVNTEAFSRDQRVDFVKDVTLACVDSRKRPFVLDYILFESGLKESEQTSWVESILPKLPSAALEIVASYCTEAGLVKVTEVAVSNEKEAAICFDNDCQTDPEKTFLELLEKEMRENRPEMEAKLSNKYKLSNQESLKSQLSDARRVAGLRKDEDAELGKARVLTRKLEGQVQFQTGRATQKEKEKKEKEVQLKAAVAERDELQLEVQLLKAQLVEAAAAGFKPTTSDPKSRHHNHHAGQHVSTQTEFGERRNLPAGVLEDDTGTETASDLDDEEDDDHKYNPSNLGGDKRGKTQLTGGKKRSFKLSLRDHVILATNALRARGRSLRKTSSMSGGGRSLAGAAAETDTAQEVNLSKVPRRSEWTTLSKAVIESHPASFATRSAMDVMIDVMKLVAADNHLVQTDEELRWSPPGALSNVDTKEEDLKAEAAAHGKPKPAEAGARGFDEEEREEEEDMLKDTFDTDGREKKQPKKKEPLSVQNGGELSMNLELATTWCRAHEGTGLGDVIPTIDLEACFSQAEKSGEVACMPLRTLLQLILTCYEKCAADLEVARTKWSLTNTGANAAEMQLQERERERESSGSSGSDAYVPVFFQQDSSTSTTTRTGVKFGGTTNDHSQNKFSDNSDQGQATPITMKTVDIGQCLFNYVLRMYADKPFPATRYIDAISAACHKFQGHSRVRMFGRATGLLDDLNRYHRKESLPVGLSAGAGGGEGEREGGGGGSSDPPSAGLGGGGNTASPFYKASPYNQLIKGKGAQSFLLTLWQELRLGGHVFRYAKEFLFGYLKATTALHIACAAFKLFFSPSVFTAASLKKLEMLVLVELPEEFSISGAERKDVGGPWQFHRDPKAANGANCAAASWEHAAKAAQFAALLRRRSPASASAAAAANSASISEREAEVKHAAESEQNPRSLNRYPPKGFVDVDVWLERCVSFYLHLREMRADGLHAAFRQMAGSSSTSVLCGATPGIEAFIDTMRSNQESCGGLVHHQGFNDRVMSSSVAVPEDLFVIKEADDSDAAYLTHASGVAVVLADGTWKHRKFWRAEPQIWQWRLIYEKALSMSPLAGINEEAFVTVMQQWDEKAGCFAEDEDELKLQLVENQEREPEQWAELFKGWQMERPILKGKMVGSKVSQAEMNVLVDGIDNAFAARSERLRQHFHDVKGKVLSFSACFETIQDLKSRWSQKQSRPAAAAD